MKKFLRLSFLFSLLLLQARAQEYKMVGNELRFEKGLTFKPNSPQLNEDDIKILNGVKDFLNEKTYITLLRIEGHVNGSESDQTLSEQRAISAAKWLIKSGIDCKRLIAVGFGNTKPAEQNTRVTFEMASLKDRLIGGMPADGGGKVAADVCKLSR